jgi:hypothetical protein
VRRLRILAICLAAMFAVSATTLVVASPAMAAKCNEECKQHKKEEKEAKEKARKEATEAKKCEKLPACVKAKEEIKKVEEELKQAKENERKSFEERLERLQKHLGQIENEYEVVGQFANCPLFDPEISDCTWGQSRAGSEFTAGKVTIALVNPITIQFAFAERAEGLETVGPEDGAPALSAVAQPGPKLSEVVDEEKLSEHEKEVLHEDEAKSEATSVTIELAGPARSMILSTENLLERTGTALHLPTKIRLTSASGFVGEDCYVGSNEDPIVVNLTSGQSGKLAGKVGEFNANKEFTLIELVGGTLVENEFSVPQTVEGCGGRGDAQERATVDEALNEGLGLPSTAPESNSAIINGNLSTADNVWVREKLEEDHVPVT